MPPTEEEERKTRQAEEESRRRQPAREDSRRRRSPDGDSRQRRSPEGDSRRRRPDEDSRRRQPTKQRPQKVITPMDDEMDAMWAERDDEVEPAPKKTKRIFTGELIIKLNILTRLPFQTLLRSKKSVTSSPES